MWHGGTHVAYYLWVCQVSESLPIANKDAYTSKCVITKTTPRYSNYITKLIAYGRTSGGDRDSGKGDSTSRQEQDEGEDDSPCP